MRPHRLIPLALIACASMTAACASWRPAPAPRRPPSLTIPAAAARPCRIATLGEAPGLADLEAAYIVRGRQLVECDLARRLAVETLEALGASSGP